MLVGGMAIGSAFTLFIIPSIYMLMAKDHTRDRVREAAGEEVVEAAGRPVMQA